MKKRIFTLLALGMLIGGFSSALNAQVEVTAVSVGYASFYAGEVYEVKVDASADKKALSTSRTTLGIRVLNAGDIAKDTTIILSTSDAADYLGLPESITIKPASAAITGGVDTVYTYNHDLNWSMPNSATGTKGFVYAYVKRPTPPAVLIGTEYKFFNYPTFTVEYMPRTAQYKGSLRISKIEGGNPELYDNIEEATNREMQRRLANKDYTHFRTDTIVLYPFSNLEVASVTYGDKIIVSAPWENYTLTIPGMKDPGIPGEMYRAITIPVVNDAAINREQGVHYVPSTENFTFIITPTGSNAGKTPVVTTGRTTLPDSEGVKYEEIGDGNWLVTIIQVQTDINLSIDFTTVSNTDIESTGSVWANGGQLYVNALASGNANVYSITGALVKTITLSAGETASQSLPTGFYVVTINGKAYKVTIK